MHLFKYVLALPAVFAAPFQVLDVRAEPIPNSWIVKVKDNADLGGIIAYVTGLTSIQPTHRYSYGTFKGFSIDNVFDLASLLENLANIESIEPNTKVYANALITQQNPPYGLARISHRNNGANTYVYDSSAGAGTFAYIIDTVSPSSIRHTQC
jgi:hypothetical protein